MTKKKGAKNPLDIKDLKEIQYKIECYVETVSSDGCVTVRGVDGYRLEKKEGEKEKTYNVFWKVKPENAESDNADEALVKILPAEKTLSLDEKQLEDSPTDKSGEAEKGKTEKVFDKELQFLLTAKASHLKVSLDVALDGAKGKDKVLIQKIALI